MTHPVDAAVATFCTPTSSQNMGVKSEPRSFASSQLSTIAGSSGQISVRAWGGRTTGSSNTLLLHGWSSSSTSMLTLLPGLLKTKQFVIAPDMPAHGGSKGVRSNYAGFATAILELEDEFGPFKSVIAHSMSCLSLALAIHGLHTSSLHHHPQRMVFLAPPVRLSDSVSAFAKNRRLVGGDRKLFESQLASFGGLAFERYNLEFLLSNYQGRILAIHDVGDQVTPYKRTLNWAKTRANVIYEQTEGLRHDRVLASTRVIRLVHDFLVEAKPGN